MITAWKSKSFNEIIPFERIICVKAGMSTGQLVVRLENDNCITIFPNEVESFLEAYETWEAIVAVVSLGIEIPKERKK